MDRLPDKHSVMFSLQEYRSRMDRLRAALSAEGIDVFMATAPENMNYLSGFDPYGIFYYQQLYLSPEREQGILLTHKAEGELARTQCWIDDIRQWSHGEDPVARTLEVLDDIGLGAGGTLGIELGRFNYQIQYYLRLREALPGVRIVDATDICEKLRLVKSPAEVALMRKAASYTDIGMQAAFDAIRPGATELEVNARIQHAMAAAGSVASPIPTLLGSGPRSGLFHALPTERVIEAGDAVILEPWGTCARYTVNICRTLIAGKADDGLRRLFGIVRDAFWKGFEAVGPGVPVGEIDRICKEARGGYEKYFPARSGFGLGLQYPNLHLHPSILEGDPHVLEPGMIFTLEPSIAQYQGNTVIVGGCILVTEDGGEFLTETDPNTFEVG